MLYPHLLPIEYDSGNDSDDKDDDTYTSKRQQWRVIHPDAMPPTASNVFNIHPRKQTDYMKERIDRLMLFAQVGNYLKEDALSFLKHKWMENSEETIVYATVSVYELTQ